MIKTSHKVESDEQYAKRLAKLKAKGIGYFGNAQAKLDAARDALARSPMYIPSPTATELEILRLRSAFNSALAAAHKTIAKAHNKFYGQTSTAYKQGRHIVQ